MPQLDAATVGQRLGLGDDHRAWLKELEAAGPSAPPPALPRSDDLALLFERLAISRLDAADLTKAWPSPDRTPEVWWLLELIPDARRPSLRRAAGAQSLLSADGLVIRAACQGPTACQLSWARRSESRPIAARKVDHLMT